MAENNVLKPITRQLSSFLGFKVDLLWPLPDFHKPHRLWKIASAIVLPTIGLFARLWAQWLNTFKVHHRERLVNALDNRPIGVPLLTVSNHYSCLDDPVLWGNLDIRHLICCNKLRWSLTASDICFTQASHAIFFGWGRCIPVIRGAGVYQRAVDFCIDRLNVGDWVHVFPEGRVNMEQTQLRFKWGIGRLIAESKICPIVIPMWHMGMDSVLPNTPPYWPRTGKTVTLLIGKPIQIEHLVDELRRTKVSDVDARKRITDEIQAKMWVLKDQAERLHAGESPQVVLGEQGDHSE